MNTVMLAVEGVLGSSPTFSVTMLPNDTGQRLFYGLVAHHRVVLATNEPSYEKVEHWLRSQGLRDYADLVTGEPGDTIDIRVAQLRALRASRTAVALLVDSEPLVVAHAASVGVPGMLYVPPRPASGRADLGARQIRDWSAIEAELDVQREIRA